jgi:hypothetical protein
MHTYTCIHACRLRASEEHQYCAFQTVAIPITRITNPMQALNFSTLMYKNYNSIAPGDSSSYFTNGVSPDLLPPPSLMLTPPLTATDRGRKGKSRSKRTIPKPSSALVPDNAEATLNFDFHTPPKTPEDCLDIRCHRGNDMEMPRSLSDLDEEEEEEMQDYRYLTVTSL